MSVFHLKEISRWLQKDERTIRRWCQSGRVEGAFQTRGGHWRVRAQRISDIAPDVKGFTRCRNEGISQLVASVNSVRKLPAHKATVAAARSLIGAERALESIGELPDLADAINHVLDMDTDFDPVRRAAVGLWARDCEQHGGRGLSALARRAGIPRTTLRRYFAKHLTPGLFARVIASMRPTDESPEDWSQSSQDGFYGAIDARLAA